MIEISYLSGRFDSEYYKRDLLSLNWQFGLIAVSGLLLIVHAIGILILIAIAIKSIKVKRSQEESKSRLLTFVKGLNTK